MLEAGFGAAKQEVDLAAFIHSASYEESGKDVD